MRDFSRLYAACLLILMLGVTVQLGSAVYTSGSMRSSGSKRMFPQSLINYDYKWSFENIEEWRPYAKADGDSAELILGLSPGRSDIPALLQRTTARLGAQIVRFIETKDGPVAAVVDVPIDQMQLFAGEVNKAGISAYVEPNFKVEILMTPNDPYWPDQWGPKKIQADLAWNTQLGSPSVKVAVVDTGVDYTHEDLADNYVSGGYDWANNDFDPMDDHGHGTHVAGTIAAKINNAKGVAGLAQVKVMAEKVLSSGGSGYYDWVANGIIHAADAGANIISMSLGGPYPSEVLEDAVEYANDAGVLVIAAAGNSNSSAKSYPAGFDGVIAVAATDQNDNKASFSNWGTWIDLAAPGVGIISSVPWGYESWSGTSMACPHVSGVAALAWSQFPNKPKDWISEWLKYTADDLGAPGFDVYYGYGRVNAFKAVTMSPPVHDLILQSVDATKFLNPGQTASVEASIMNFGSADETNLTVQFSINGTLEETQIIPALASSQVTEVTFVTDPLEKAKYDMTVNVVPVPGETKTDNNSGSTRTVVDDIIKVPEHFATIQEAVDASRPGDTISVAKGFYSEEIFIFKEDLTIYGEANNQTALDGGFLVYANSFHLRNFNYTWGGVYFYGVSDGLVENCYFRLASPAILVSNGENITYRNSVSFGFLFNVILLNSSNAVIENNYIANSVFGVIVDGYGTNYIRNNEFVGNYYGMYLGYGWIPFAVGNNVFRNNHISGHFQSMNRSSGIGFWGTEVTHFIHDIDTSNTVQGKPVYYLINHNNLLINPSTYPSIGLLALVNSSRVTVENIAISYVQNGILSAFTRDSVVNNVSISYADWGLRIIRSSNVSISNSRITTSYDLGIYLQDSTQVKMRSNRISTGSWRNFGVVGEELMHFMHDIDTSNTINGLPIYYIVNSQGMTLPKNASYVAAVNSTNIIAKKLELVNNEQGMLLVNTRNSLVEDVKFYNNTYAIQLIDSFNNTIKGNHIQSSWSGIEFTRSNSNKIYLNNLMGLVYEKIETESVNTWYGRWNVTGNFWEDYVGNDTNHDGIGDTGLPVQGVDTHPLMAPHLPGDINYDGIVTQADLDIFSAAYGSLPGYPNWNPHADINEDAKVDMRDIAVAASNYNKTWTDYWKVGKVSLTVLAKDQYGNALTMMDVSIDGVKVGKTGSTFLVAPNVKHTIYVSPSNTTIIPGTGKYVYTFSYYDVFGQMITSNPMYLTISTSASITAYYTRTYYAELKVYAKDQYGAYVTTIPVTIDGSFVGYTGSTFYVLSGQHSIYVQSPYEKYASRYGNYVYTFQRWSDGVTSNPRTMTINSATSLTAIYYKEFVPNEEPPYPVGPGPTPI